MNKGILHSFKRIVSNWMNTKTHYDKVIIKDLEIRKHAK